MGQSSSKDFSAGSCKHKGCPHKRPGLKKLHQHEEWRRAEDFVLVEALPGVDGVEEVLVTGAVRTSS